MCWIQDLLISPALNNDGGSLGWKTMQVVNIQLETIDMGKSSQCITA